VWSVLQSLSVYLSVTGTELSDSVRDGVSSPFVSAGFVWSVLQSVYASGRPEDVTNTSLGAAVNDVCHFLLSKVSPYTGSRDFGVFGTFYSLFMYLVIILWRNLLNILRQSYDYLTTMPKLRSTYNRCLNLRNILR